MLITTKFQEYFDPTDIKDRVHIIGCGAIGSTLAENLVRMGFTKFTLYDFDKVEMHNIANQMFLEADIGKEKTMAVAEHLVSINSDVDIKICPKGYIAQNLNGYVFLCVDNIDLRRQITEANIANQYIKSIVDFRMRLTDSQHYLADWSKEKDKTSLINSMQFTHEEAKALTPTTACGTTLNVVYNVRAVVAIGVANFINFVTNGNYHRQVMVDCGKILNVIFM